MLENFIIERIKNELPFVPNEGQEVLLGHLGRFLVSRDEHKAFLLRGYAGTGKTSLVSALVRALSKLHQSCVLLAPTGRAAKVLSHYSGFPAYTIHKHIYRQERIGSESFGLSDNKLFNTLFIVDEASMISAETDNPTFGSGNLLDDLIRFVYCEQHCSILFLGDDAQLPPVGQTDSLALDADYLAGFGLSITTYSLTQVARQALDSQILVEATAIRERLNTTDEIEPICEGKDIRRLTGGEDFLEQLERSYREVGVDQTLILTRTNKRTNLYNQGVRNRILWREELLSTGDRLMVSKNNYFWTEKYDNLPFLANGDMLEVVRLRNERELYGYHFVDVSLKAVDYDWEIDAVLWLDTLTTDSPEANYALQKDLWLKVAEDYPEIRSKKELWKTIMANPYYNALQVRFAYAVTCHKAQGGQWKHVYIDPGKPIGGETERLIGREAGSSQEEEQKEYLRWFYTALTRATEQVFLLNC